MFPSLSDMPEIEAGITRVVRKAIATLATTGAVLFVLGMAVGAFLVK